jgi:hypothetical protein
MTRREVLLSVEIPDVDMQEFNTWLNVKASLARAEYIFTNNEEE